MSGKRKNRRMLKAVSGILAAVILCTSVDVSAFAAEQDGIDEVAELSEILNEPGTEEEEEIHIQGEEAVYDEHEGENDNEATKPTFGGGKGTEEDPYLISSYRHLEQIHDLSVEGYYVGGYFKLTNDITANEDLENPTNIWTTPKFKIGYVGFHFDGAGHTIKNLYIEEKLTETWSSNSISFLGDAATVRNLTLDGVKIVCTQSSDESKRNASSVSAFAGKVREISNCYLKGDVSFSNEAGYISAASGMVYSAGHVQNCHIEGNLHVFGEADYVAGMAYSVSKNYYSDCYIKGCTVTGSVIAENSKNVTGIVFNLNGDCEECNTEETAVISGTEEVSGIADSVSKDAVIQNCINAATLSSGKDINGIARYVQGKIISCVNKGVFSTKGEKWVGGWWTGIADTVYGTLRDCKNQADLVMPASEEPGIYTGSLSGIANIIANGSDVRNVVNEGNLTGMGQQLYVCGISDNVQHSNSPLTISGCINTGTIVANNASNGASGLFGSCTCSGSYGVQSVIKYCRNEGNVTSSYCASGIVLNCIHETKVFACKNTGKIEGRFGEVGGIAGEVWNDSCEITDSSNEGIIINGSGIVGNLKGGTVSRCSNKSDIKWNGDTSASGIAGIAGDCNISGGSVITDCYNSGNISFSSKEGISGIGGIIGEAGIYNGGSLDVSRCYSIGKISGAVSSEYKECIGLFAGTVYIRSGSSSIKSDYFLNGDYKAIGHYENEVDSADPQVNGCTDAQLKKQATYTDWDFTDTWEMGTGDYPYPTLRARVGEICNVTFDANGGTFGETTTVTYTTGNMGTITSFPRPKKDGERFIGWYTAAEGGERISREYIFDADTTVYAHWGVYNEEDRVEIIPVNPAAGAKGVRYLDDGNFIKLSISFETKSPIKSVDPSAGSFRIINKKTGKAIYETGANNASLFHVSSRDGVSTVEYTHYSGFEPLTEYCVEMEDGFLVFEDEKLYAYTDPDDWCFTTMEKIVLTEIELPNEGSKKINFKPDLFSESSYEYNPELSELSACLACMVYENDAKDEDQEHERIAKQFQKLGFDPEVSTGEFISRHFFEDPTGNFDDKATRGNYSPSWIVHKTITINGEDNDLFCVVIRGTYHKEWIDNFDPGVGTTHMGFERATNFIREKIADCIKNTNPKNKIKILVTGHSRGAAVANLLGKRLDDDASNTNRENIYVYTYASPNATSDERITDSKYTNIFNIINPEDFVTKVLPRKWGYGRYGINYVLPSRTIYPDGFYTYPSYDSFVANVQNKTRIYIGSETKSSAKDYRVYNSYDEGMVSIELYVGLLTQAVSNIEKYYDKQLGSDSEKNRSEKSNMKYAESSLFTLFTESLGYYMAKGKNKMDGLKNLVSAKSRWDYAGLITTVFFVYNGKVTPQFGSAHTAETYMAMLDLVPVDTLKKPKSYNKVRVSCPVDVTVKDKDGNVIGQVTDKIITKTTNELAMEVEGDSKSFFIHEGADYKIELVGNDTGTMDYTIVKYDADEGEIERVVYQDVPLEKGTAYTQDLHGYESAEETPLFDEKSQVVKKSLELTEDDLGKLSISVNVIGNGNATSYESVTPGDYVMLTASPDIGNEFDGWYDKDGNLISSDDKFGLSVKKSEELTAKFKEMEGIVASPIDPQTYAGVALAPVIELYDGSGQLTPGTDYTVTYKNNKNAYTFEDADKLTDAQKKKAPQAIIKMKGNYSGQKVLYFCINPLSINDEAAFEASVKKGKKTVIFKYNDKALKENVDYTVGSVTDEAVTVTGKGNFTGTHEFPLTTKEGITNVSMSKVIVDSIPTQFYTGTALTVDTLKGKDGSSSYAVKVSYPKGTELTAGKDYMVAKIYNSVNAGTATVVLKGLKAGGTAGASDKYSFTGEKRIKFKIDQCPMDRVVVTGSDGSKNLSAVYRKSGAKPEKLMVAIDGRTLKEGRDYTVKYSANTKYTGTGDKSAKDGKLTVTGRGNYKGSKSVVFTITRRPFSEEAGINVNAADMPYVNKAGKFMSDVKVYDSEGKLLKAGIDYEKVIKYVAADGSELSKTSVPEEDDVITVFVTGKGGYTSDTIRADYKILKAGEVNDISKAKISIDPVAYRSGRVILTGDNASCVHASMGKDKKSLTFSTDGIDGDFMVLPGSYENNDKKGTAKVTFVGINNYSGSKTVTVKIGTRSLMDWWRGYFY